MKDVLLDLAGYCMLLVFALTALVHYLSGNLLEMTWFSNHTTLLIGIAILSRSRFWLTAETALAVLPEYTWISDFVYHYATGEYLTGATTYLTQMSPAYYALAMQHLLVLPVAVICLWHMGAQHNSYIGVFLHGVVLWVTGYMLNTNCTLTPCVSFLAHKVYFVFWPFLMLFLGWLSYRLLLICFGQPSEGEMIYE
ncbi:hypothetical protein HY639_00800 [Candidatus Woesearchaeota archaeon]|nr:hypothetical protein [Candidatus Woesearchaeota archaeon]